MMTSSLDGTTNNRRRPKPRKADNTTVTTPSTPVVQALTPPRNVYNLKRSVFSKPKLTEMIKLSGTRTSDQFWLRFGTARIVGGTGSMMQLPGVRPVAAAEEQLKQYPRDIAKHRLAIDVFAIDYTPHSRSTFELHATAVSRH